MKKYNVSGVTKNAMLQAAGRLFAEKGPAAVTAKEVAEAAGASPNAVTYHFGGREGLVPAVWNYVLQVWKHSEMDGYWQRNRHLLETRDGKRQLVSEVVERIFRIIYVRGEDRWISRLALRAMLLGDGRGFIEKRIVTPWSIQIQELYGVLTGSSDQEKALCWAYQILSGITMLAANICPEGVSRGDGGEDDRLYRRLLHTTTQNALFSAGLLRPSGEGEWS